MFAYLFTFFKKPFKNNHETITELLEKENAYLDAEIREELNIEEAKFDNEKNTQSESTSSIQELGSACSLRKGVITKLEAYSGIIDKKLYFDSHSAISNFQDLKVGCVIEYLAYDTGNLTKVVKVQQIVEKSWDHVSDTKVEELVNSVQKDQPKFFDMQVRKILGTITQRLATTLEVDTDYGEQIILLESVELSFVPKTGDNVSLSCDVQLDEGYVDKQGEILQVKRITPARLETDVKCVVERVLEDIIAFNNKVYMHQEDLPTGLSLFLGDIILADLIECSYGKYSSRVIKLTLLEKNFGHVKDMPNTSVNYNSRAVSIHGESVYIFTEKWKKHNIILKVRNSGSRPFELRSINIENKVDGQIKVVEPLNKRTLGIGDELAIILEVESKFVGESRESLLLLFDTFKVKRTLTIILYESILKAREAKRRLIACEPLMVAGRSAAQRARLYTSQVWSADHVLVPGEGVAPKRRFVNLRLGSYNVPEKLREIVLGTEVLAEMIIGLEDLCPCLKRPLDIDNYTAFFSTLLHLEEITYTLNFRNFDRERAHFQRDGEFLSLHIDNLSERRPSIVLGDTVRATNPWLDSDTTENKAFEGVVHKALFNRVLLKFNSNFQQKYNGEDYRLTFHFSRYSFRKQHYALGCINKKFGEQFLFPKTVVKHDHPQLEVTFKDDHMYLYDDKLPWYNKSLNSIQKRAVFHILRGETDNMPYVIFGPPGTGKTVTLVEAILQLIRNLPNSRLLVGTPSNSSADIITKRIIDSQALEHGDFIRLVSQNQVEKDQIPPELMSYCATGDIGIVDANHDSMIVSDSGLKLRCQKRFLIGHRVTIGTCTTLGNFLQMSFPVNHFTHALIDEAGQCSEPETIVPLVLLAPNRSQTILAGDPHQLPAIVTSRTAESYGLSLSLLERIIARPPYRKDMQRFPDTSGYDPCLLTKLLYNYRALSSIMCVYSRLFYDSELISMIADNSKEALLLQELQSVFEPHKGMPALHGTFFYGVMGENRQDADSPSWYNAQEAREIFLMTINLYRRHIHPDQIGILTPYSKQVKTLRGMFMGADVAMPKIGSAEEFQGQERYIMLISTVRSTQTLLDSDARHSLGFVCCKKRMNVATSRARSLMVIYGNPQLLSVDVCWRHLINYCVNNNAYLGCELPEAFKNSESNDSVP